MIPGIAIDEWSEQAPWHDSEQVEQDLILSRALVELFSNQLLQEQLIFRGGTALHKLVLNKVKRYSEDIDFVQKQSGPIGPVLTTIRKILEPWLGKSTWKLSRGRATVYYKFNSEIPPIQKMKVKIEINTREHFQYFNISNITHRVDNKWFQGEALIPTYSIEELLATKFRALYQRKKGRDLFDLFIASQELPNLNFSKVIECFQYYMEKEGRVISRAEFKRNLIEKLKDNLFLDDIKPLLSAEQNYDPKEAYQEVLNKYIILLPE